MSIARNLTLSGHKRKSTAPHSDALPSEVITERFTSWKDVTKQLSSYFEGVVDVEGSYAKSYLKLGSLIETPFKPTNEFMDKGGLQDIFDVLRDKTHVIAEQHANFAKTVDTNIVKQFHKLRNDIKSHLKDIENDTAKLAAIVHKDREHTTKIIGELASSIANMDLPNNPNIKAEQDPFIVNAKTKYALQKQIHNENLHQKSAVIMQKNSEKFEGEIVQHIQAAWTTFGELQSKKAQAVVEIQASLVLAFKALDPTAEWLSFKERRKDTLISPDAPLRDEEKAKWPQMDDPATQPLHKGTLQRKKRIMGGYKESFFVVTQAGYLHEYPSSDPASATNPEFSLYLPACTLGAQSSDSSKSMKFNIEEGKQSGASRGLRGSLGMKSEHAWEFKAENRTEMQMFWEAIKPLCQRHLQSIETGAEKKANIQAAVVGKTPAAAEHPIAEGREAVDDGDSLSGGSYQGSEAPSYGFSDPGFAGVGAGTGEKKIDPVPEEPVEAVPTADAAPVPAAAAPAPAGHAKEKSASTDSKFTENV